MGMIAGAGSLIGGLAGLFGGGGAQSVPPPTPAYQYANMPGADIGAYGLIGNQAGWYPEAGSIAQAMINNPYAGQGIATAAGAGQMGVQGAGTQFGTGYGLLGQGMGAFPYANQALYSAFDPQGDVYNRLFQQNTDQTRALLEQRGIDTTPYGAGVEAQSNIGFNTAWQQNLQNRQAMGAQTYGGLMGAGAGAIQQGLGDISGAPGQMYAAGFMPYNAAQQVGQGQLGAITSAQGIAQQPISNYLSYLGGGTQAAQAGTQQYQAALQAQQQQFNQQQAYMKQIGQGIGGIGNYFGGPTGNIGNMPATGAGSPNAFQSNMYAMSQGINPWG